MRITPLLALLALLAFAAPAAAVTQTTTDPSDPYVDGFVQSTDFRSFTWDTTSQPGFARLGVDLSYAAEQDLGGAVLIDTNADNKTDYAIEISAASGVSKHPGLDGDGGRAYWYVRHVTSSTTTCQAYADGYDGLNPFVDYTLAPATRTISGDPRTQFTLPIPLSALGNATSWRWAAVGLSSDGFFSTRYDFAPDGSNGVPDEDPRGNRVEQDPWFCSPLDDGLSAGYRVNMANATPFNTVVIEPPPPVNQAPTVSIFQSPALARPGQPVSLVADGRDSDGSVVEYAWDLDNNGDFDDSDRSGVIKTFPTAGTYRVGVRVKDDKGATTFAYREIEVANRPTTFSLSASKLNPVAREKIDITANITSDFPVADQDIEWALVFGVSNDDSGNYDKNRGRAWNVSFGVPGPWTVKARFKDADGKTVSARIQIDVPNQKPVLRDFRIRKKLSPDNPFNSEPMVKGEPILLTIGFTDDDFPTPPRAEWDLDGDGTYDDAVGSTVEKTYATSGEKRVGVRVVDSAGQFVLGSTSFEIRESAETTCNGKAGDGDLRLVGCFKTDSKDKGIKTTKEPVDLNGLQLVPQDGAQINYQAVGGLLFITGPGTVKIKLGTVELFEGRFQLDPNCDPKKTECLLGKFNSPITSTLKGLPLKGEVEVYLNPQGTRVHINLDVFGRAGFGGTAAADVRSIDGQGLVLDSLEVRSPMIGIKNLTIGQFFIKYDGKTRVWAGGGSITLPTPQFTTLTGDFAFSELYGFQRAHGEVDGLNIPIDEFGTVYLQRIAFTLEIKGFEPNGSPRVRFGGGIGFSAGPRFAGIAPATVDGDFLLTFGNPTGIDAEGRIGIAGFDIMYGSVSAYTNGDVSLSGTISFGLPFPKALKGMRTDGTKVKVSRVSPFGADVYNPYFQLVSVYGTAKAWVEPQAFDLEAEAGIKVIGITLAKAHGLLSSKGVAGCGEVVGIAGGFGYDYATDKTDLFSGSCDLDKWRPARTYKPLDDNGAGTTARAAGDAEPRQAAPPAGGTIDVAEGQKALVIRLNGKDGDPLVALVSPDGKRYEMPADGKPVQGDDFFAARQPLDENATYIGVRAPKAGKWTIEALPGSPAIASVDGAAVLPEPEVSASVKATGRMRTVSYKVKPIPGQVVRFVEEGDNNHKTIGVAKGASGSFTFVPQEAKDRTRSVIAIVEQGGLVRKRITVAAFVAPPVIKPGKPRGLVATRSAKGKPASVSLSWKKVTGISRYQVVASFPSGEERLFPLKGTRVTIPKVSASTPVTFDVRSVVTNAKTSDWTRLKLPKGVARIPRPTEPKPPHPVVHPKVRAAITLF